MTQKASDPPYMLQLQSFPQSLVYTKSLTELLVIAQNVVIPLPLNDELWQ